MWRTGLADGIQLEPTRHAKLKVWRAVIHFDHAACPDTDTNTLVAGKPLYESGKDCQDKRGW